MLRVKTLGGNMRESIDYCLRMRLVRERERDLFGENKLLNTYSFYWQIYGHALLSRFKIQ